MKKTLAIFLILLFYTSFLFVENNRTSEKRVIRVITPTVFEIDLNNNGSYDTGEKFCISNIKSFSTNLNPDSLYLEKILKLSKKDSITIGYFADEYAKSTLLNKKVKLKNISKNDYDCQNAEIIINGISYQDLLKNSGFAIVNEKPVNRSKFEKILNKAKHTELVILNNSSNKYHKLDCKYGKMANNSVILPKKDLSKEARPCKFCHIQNKSNRKKLSAKEVIYPESITDGHIKLYITDFTRNLKPNNSCNSNVCKEILNKINSSNKSIDIAAYGWNDNPTLEKAIYNAKARGVKFRLVYDRTPQIISYYKGTENLVKLADESLSDISDLNSETAKLMHNKFIIIDKKLVITGSMNFSNTGLSGFNSNSIIFINSETIANKYREEFEQMLSGKFHNNKNKFSTETYYLDNSKIKIFFSPQDKIITTHIIPMINNSRKEILIPAFLVTHTEVVDSLISAHKRGVLIKIIIDATGYHNNIKKIQKLRNSGILVKVENYAGKMHAKTMLIDEKYLITGSMNFSQSGEIKNDENCLIIENPKLVKFYKGYFNYVWEKIPDRYLKHGIRAESKFSIGSCSDGIDNNFDGKIDKDDAGCQ